MSAQIGQLGVVGAGFMGSGIAESAARAGVAVTLYEPEGGALQHSRERIESSVARAVERGRLNDGEAEALVKRIEWSTELDALREADLVIEAIVEDERVKAQTFEALDGILAPEADRKSVV